MKWVFGSVAIALLLGTLILSGQAASATETTAPVAVQMNTELGSFVVEVHPGKAPATSAAFLANVRSLRYDGAGFFRSVRSDNDNSKPSIQILQGGVMSERAPGEARTVAHESTRFSGLRHTDGAISLARTEVGTATADNFFISIGAQPALDFGGKRNPDGQGFAVFGKVICGMEVIRKIHRVPTTGKNSLPVMRGQILEPPVKIESARVVKLDACAHRR